MIKKFNIKELKQVSIKEKSFITKFGGYPNWINNKEWPVSLGWKDRKMMFVGQISLKKGMLGNDKDLMIYIFLTHPKNYEDTFFDPDIMEWESGESEVIIQSIEDELENFEIDMDGPIIFNERNENFEYIPILEEEYDPEYITNESFRKLDSKQQNDYFEAIDTNKIGGIPNFFREEAFPEGEWILLLQLKCNELPFVIRAGSMAVLYVFVSKDFSKAGVLIQD